MDSSELQKDIYVKNLAVEQIDSLRIGDGASVTTRATARGNLTDSVARLEEMEQVKTHLDNLMQGELIRRRSGVGNVSESGRATLRGASPCAAGDLEVSNSSVDS